MNEVMQVVGGCLAWVALCAAACVLVCAVVYTSNPEGGAR